MKKMSQVQSFFVTLTMEFDPFFEQFNIANYFWTVSAIALIIHIFHMSIPSDKTFLWTPLFFHPVTLTLEFDPFYLKTLTLLITFEQRVLELCYITWVFQVTTLVSRYLSLLPWPSLELPLSGAFVFCLNCSYKKFVCYLNRKCSFKLMATRCYIVLAKNYPGKCCCFFLSRPMWYKTLKSLKWVFSVCYLFVPSATNHWKMKPQSLVIIVKKLIVSS